jgi:hypothetical protein
MLIISYKARERKLYIEKKAEFVQLDNLCLKLHKKAGAASFVRRTIDFILFLLRSPCERKTKKPLN